MYLFEEGELRRVSDYQLVTKFIEMIDTDKEDGDEKEVNYLINERCTQLHQCSKKYSEQVLYNSEV